MTDRNYGALRESKAAIAQISKVMASGKPFAFDIEAGYTGDDKVGVSLQQFHPDYLLVGVSFTTSTSWARYIPIAHDDGGNVDDIPAVALALWQMLNTGMGVAHNAAYELKGMSRWFRENLWYVEEVRQARGMFPIRSDTMLEVWFSACYDPIRVGKDLKSVAKHEFGLEMTNFMDLFPNTDSDLGPATKRGKTKVVRFNTRNSYATEVINYACEDSVASLMIHLKLYDAIKDEFMFKTELALLPVLVEMEMGPVDENGKALGNMLFDWPEIRRREEEVLRFADLMNEEIQRELSERLGQTININLGSVQQLSKVLFEKRPDGLGLPVKMRSEKTGAPSTSDDALRVIAKTDPIIKKILQYRQVKKLASSYLTKFLNELNYSGTGVVFPNHNQAGALTGRSSVDQVSYQQWPKPYHFELSSGETFDLNFRDLWVAQEGFRQVGFDYANVELRVAGALSGEDKIIDAFNEGRDLHRTTAAAAFKIPFEEVDGKHRGYGKALADREVVLTPSGWIPIGQLAAGDEVVLPTGGKTTVEAVFPQGERQIFEVQFDDGSVVLADGEHLWPVYHVGEGTESLKTTQALLDSGLVSSTGSGRTTWKWGVRNVEPLEFDGPSELGIDPYLLGLLLGDGALSGPSVSLAIGPQDTEEALPRVRSLLPEGIEIVPNGKCDYRLTSQVPGAWANRLSLGLMHYGLRGTKAQFNGTFGCRSWEKFIPEEYLFAGIEQRYSLLRGIMDADGTVQNGGRALLTTTSKRLAEHVVFLTRTLGGRGLVTRERKTKYTYLGERKEGRTSYEVLVDTPECPFLLSRKADRWSSARLKKHFRSRNKKITAITAAGIEPATCIRVADPLHEFITAGVTRTHNTLNFQILYGGGAAAVSDALTALGDPVSKEQAQDMIDGFMDGYSKLSAWINAQQVIGREQKEVYTHFGRKFTIWEHYDHREWIKAKGDRMAVNAPVQGTAADIIKIAMVRAQRKIKAAGWQDLVRLTLTVHDALEFLVHESITTQQVIDLIDPAVNFPVPGFPLEIRADWHEGYRWGSVVEVKLDADKKIVGYGIDGSDDRFDTFEEAVEALNASRAGKSKAAAQPPVEEDEEEQEWFHSATYWAEHAQLVTVSMDHMPDEDQWAKFTEFLASRPGHDEVRLETPEGTLTFDSTHKLAESDQPHISLLLGGASVHVGAREADPDDVMGVLV